MMEKGVADGVGGGLCFTEGVDVSDDGFCALENAECIADDATAPKSNITGKDAAIEVLEQHGGGAGVVPVKAALPAVRFIAQEWLQLRRGEVAEVKDLELLRWIQRGGPTLAPRINLVHRQPLRLIQQEWLGEPFLQILLHL